MPGSLTHQFFNPFKVARILLSDRSVYRAHVNLAIRSVELRGDVLDLGSKSTASSYYRYLRRADPCRVTCTDLAPGDGIVCLNVEHPFPLESSTYDAVLAFNLFEHVRHFERAPAEILRVLRPGGAVYVVVPFLHEYHADPDDFFRYTDSGLRAIWEGAGFETRRIDALGDGLLTYAITKIAQQTLPPFVRPALAALLYLLSWPVDRVVALRPRVNGRTVPERFPLGYLAEFRKPATVASREPR